MRTFWIIYAVVAFTAAVTVGFIAVRPPFPVYVDHYCPPDPKDCG